MRTPGSKKNFEGGTMRLVMVAEVKRALAKYGGEKHRVNDLAALELGVTPRVLLKWRGPVEKGGWPELQSIVGAMDKLNATKQAKRGKPKLTLQKKVK